MRLWPLLLLCLALPATPAAAVQLSGTVTRSDTAAPVAGAVVLVRGTARYGISDAAGAYAITNLPAGSYGLSCAAPGLGGVSTNTVGLSDDTLRDFSLDPIAEGTLVVQGTASCAGTPCGGVLVLAVLDNQITARGISAASGSFSLSGLTEGTYDIRARGHGFLPVEQTGVAISAAALPSLALDLPAGGPFTLSGFVGLSDNPLDRSGSLVALNGAEPSLSALTDSGGSYTLVGVPAGLLSLTASHDSYNPTTQIDVLVSGDRSLNFALGRSGTPGDPTYALSGTVLLAPAEDGGSPGPAAGARVSLWSVPNGWRGSARCDGDGHYRISGAPVGRYQAGAAAEGTLEQVTGPFDLAANRTQDFTLDPESEYDWGPGTTDGELGCGCRAAAGGGSLALLVALALALGRRRGG